jgi:uncharacterized membrane protein YfcA
VYTSFLMAIEQFSTNEAIPITMSLIFVCSVATFYTGAMDKKSHPENKFVDFDMVVVFCPTILLGAKMGAILNKITGKLIVVAIMSWFNANVIWKIYNNATKQRDKENEGFAAITSPVRLEK